MLEAPDLRVENKGLITRASLSETYRVSSAPASSRSRVVLGQTFENTAILRDHSSSGVDHPRADLNGRQNNDAAAHGRLHEITLVQICRTEGVLIERHGQAIALPTNLDGGHSPTS